MLNYYKVKYELYDAKKWVIEEGANNGYPIFAKKMRPFYVPCFEPTGS